MNNAQPNSNSVIEASVETQLSELYTHVCMYVCTYKKAQRANDSGLAYIRTRQYVMLSIYTFHTYIGNGAAVSIQCQEDLALQYLQALEYKL